eukprot:6465609-Amphidinium_carterae.4
MKFTLPSRDAASLNPQLAQQRSIPNCPKVAPPRTTWCNPPPRDSSFLCLTFHAAAARKLLACHNRLRHCHKSRNLSHRQVLWELFHRNRFLTARPQSLQLEVLRCALCKGPGRTSRRQRHLHDPSHHMLPAIQIPLAKTDRLDHADNAAQRSDDVVTPVQGRHPVTKFHVVTQTSSCGPRCGCGESMTVESLCKSASR